MTYEEFIEPFEGQLERLYEAQSQGEEEVDFDNEAVLEQMWTVLNKDLTSLGHLRGTIDGGGICCALGRHFRSHASHSNLPELRGGAKEMRCSLCSFSMCAFINQSDSKYATMSGLAFLAQW